MHRNQGQFKHQRMGLLAVVVGAGFGGCARSPSPAVPTTAAAGTGTATLSWSAPTLNTGGTQADVAGYHVYYGTNPSQLKPAADLKGAAATRYVVTGLGAGTYYFAVRAYNAAGQEGPASNLGSKTF